MTTPPDHTTEESFLAMLADREDSGTLLVYADWLEERGDPARAEVLRLQGKLVDGIAGPERVATAIRMLELGRKLDPAWRAAISHPSVAGSCWSGVSDSYAFVARFLPDGAVCYSQLGRAYQNATWVQVGRAVGIETNRHYADYEGVIGPGDAEIVGEAHNIAGSRWSWKVARTADPEVARIPIDVVTTVFDDHVKRPPGAPTDGPEVEVTEKALPKNTAPKRATKPRNPAKSAPKKSAAKKPAKSAPKASKKPTKPAAKKR